MGMGGALYRISLFDFGKVKKTKILNVEFKSKIDVDKLWEPIMYIFGRGNLGKEPTVSLFVPENIIIKYQDEYITEGIRFHDLSAIIKIHDSIKGFTEDEIRGLIEIGKINSRVMYPVREEDVDELISYALEIIDIFKLARDEGDIIIGEIG